MVESTMLKTAIVTDRSYLKHFAGRAHPERAERVAAMIEMAETLERPNLRMLAPRPATLEEIALCHDRDYIEAVARSASVARFDFDPDTHTCPDSYATALLSAGGVLTAAEAVIDGAEDNAFAIVRPPGHHARPSRAMGFCFFNNVAIAARWLVEVRGLERVMIVDWDLHHGNGTQEIFYESAQVLYASTHQYPHYPGTGSLHEMGAGAGAGFTVNAPMPAEFGDDEYLRFFDEFILPIGRKFRPQFVIVSAGFDCHFRDPLGDMRVTESGFAAMTRRVKELAAECCEGRMIAALEGGYDLEALVNSGRAVIEELGREADEPIAMARGGERVTPIIERAARGVGKYWDLD
jgi:acetoin utilization deacetylase AcuC-like enzyme